VSVLAQILPFDKPVIDWHAFSPEIVLVAGLCLFIVADVVKLDAFRRLASTLAGWILLGAMIPILTLAWNGDDRSMFGGAFVVDNFALIIKATFLLSAYVVVLLSTNYIAEGDYWENEYYEMLLSSVLGMVLIASARDLITLFVALELLSIPAYLMATWRKRDLKSNEAGLKYYLMGVFASSLMLYGMSLLFGVSGSTLLTDISRTVGDFDHSQPVITLGIILVVVGFAFKVSSFPFHTWAPDTYEGAPTPVTSFLAVASKTAGFVALLQLVFVAFPERHDVFEPLMWVLAAGSMTFGNLVALRQTNMVRLMAYSGIAQAGYMLAPLVVVGRNPDTDSAALEAIVTYLAIYAAMNLGAFAVIMAVARKTRTAEIDSYRGLFQYAPGLTVAMTVFLMSLAGIPPLGGWFAKFQIIKALVSDTNTSGVVLAIVVGVNSVIALFYYSAIARRMWADEVPDGDVAPIRIPPSLFAALGITAAVTLLFGVFPQVVGHVTDVTLAAAGG
jgi:NADH-quinone oxidoreductase subunit N